MAQGLERHPAPGKALMGTALGWVVSAKLPVHWWLRLAQIHNVLVFTPNKSESGLYFVAFSRTVILLTTPSADSVLFSLP